MPEGMVSEQRYLEFNSEQTLLEFIHSLQRIQTSLPKEFVGDRIEPDLMDGYLNGLSISFSRPETEEEKEYRLSEAQKQRDRAERQKMKQFLALKAEFDGREIPEDIEEEVQQEAVAEPPRPLDWGQAAFNNGRIQGRNMLFRRIDPDIFVPQPNPRIHEDGDIRITPDGERQMYDAELDDWIFVDEDGNPE